MMEQTNNTDTIAAIATPMGEGGIGIVRLSGGNAINIAKMIFSSPGNVDISASDDRAVYYGHIKSPSTGEIVDEVLLTVMKGPATYTSEDVVEINCHGGRIPLEKVLTLCITSGARLAAPGEFTKRAFLSGRIDLSQAEAVLDIIRSRSDMAQRIAVDQLKGVFSEEVKRLRDMALDILSVIELGIDFTDEDVEFTPKNEITRKIDDLDSAISKVLETSGKGMMLRQGVSVVICGRPNVGKSSILNALLRRERAIVTPVPGTTRDTIEESLAVSGVEVRLTDTAGITETLDVVEEQGVSRSREKINCADIALFVIDLSRRLSEEDMEIFDLIHDKKKVLVANKSDLPQIADINEAGRRFGGVNIIEVSAKEGTGLDILEDALAETMFDGDNIEISETPVVANMRHKEALEKALENLKRAKKASRSGASGELLASDLKEAVHWLGFITGESVEEAVLDRIFSQFCIGK